MWDNLPSIGHRDIKSLPLDGLDEWFTGGSRII
jgi:hypothetical protein